jgi:hypothetical protein
MAAIAIVAAGVVWLIERTRPGPSTWRRAIGTTIFVLAGGLLFALIAAVAP